MHDQARAVLLHLRRHLAAASHRLVVRPWVKGGMLALASAALVWTGGSFARRPPRGSGDDADMATVWKARRYIPAGTALDPALLTSQPLPRSLVPPGALVTLEELVNTRQRLRFRTAVPLLEGQWVSRNHLQEIDAAGGLMAILEPHQVAVSFAVDRSAGAGGWVQPGDWVALFYAPRQTEEKSWHVPVSLLFPVVKVLAVDRQRVGQPLPSVSRAGPDTLLDLPEESGSVLTVAVTPLEALTLLEAQANGRVSVGLRADTQPWDSDLFRKRGFPHDP